MTPSVSSGSGTNAAQNSSGDQPAARGQVTKDMFLQLLVAELQHQDPLNPTDSIQYLTQLAQFQQLEQNLNTGQDIQAIRAAVEKLAPAGGSQPTDS